MCPERNSQFPFHPAVDPTTRLHPELIQHKYRCMPQFAGCFRCKNNKKRCFRLSGAQRWSVPPEGHGKEAFGAALEDLCSSACPPAFRPVIRQDMRKMEEVVSTWTGFTWARGWLRTGGGPLGADSGGPGAPLFFFRRGATPAPCLRHVCAAPWPIRAAPRIPRRSAGIPARLLCRFPR